MPMHVDVETFGAALRRLERSIDLLTDEVELGNKSQIKQRIEEVRSLMVMVKNNKPSRDLNITPAEYIAEYMEKCSEKL